MAESEAETAGGAVCPRELAESRGLLEPTPRNLFDRNPDFPRVHRGNKGVDYRWKKKDGGLEVSEARRLKERESESLPVPAAVWKSSWGPT